MFHRLLSLCFAVVVGNVVSGCSAKDVGAERVELERAWFGGVRDEFLAEVGLPTEADVPLRAPAAVTIALPDAASADELSDRTSHARALAAIVRRLTCADGGECSAQMDAELALPREGTHGERWGTPRDLAIAIDRLVDRWIEAKSRPGESNRHMIVDLSVGWEPDAPVKGPPEAPRAGEDDDGAWAVHQAIRRATCEGALVIAAAGNDDGYAQTIDGPMLPAAWERFPITCDEGAAARPRQLLHSVSGLHRAAPVPMTRAGGRPRLAAPAYLGVAFDDDPEDAPLTGTSVAAAVTSSVAAAVWSRRPSLDADGVIQILRDAAEPLAYGADYCVDDRRCGAAARVSLCASLARACEDGEELCPASPIVCAADARAPQAAKREAAAQLERAFAAAPRVAAPRTSPEAEAPILRAATGRVRPQGDQPICGVCTWASPLRDLYVDIVGRATYTGTMLTLYDGSTVLGTYRGLSPDPATYGDQAINHIELGRTDATAATLSWLLSDGTRHVEAIAVSSP